MNWVISNKRIWLIEIVKKISRRQSYRIIPYNVFIYIQEVVRKKLCFFCNVMFVPAISVIILWILVVEDECILTNVW